MVTMEASDLISGTRARILPPRLWKALTTASVPCRHATSRCSPIRRRSSGCRCGRQRAPARCLRGSERRRDIVAERYPDIPVSLSSDVLPEFREYDRAITAVMNDYVRPIMRNYLSRIEERMRELGVTSRLHIVRSDGVEYGVGPVSVDDGGLLPG